VNKTYDDGLRDGKIQAIEDIEIRQNERLDNHGTRISNLEKALYGVMAIVVFIEFAPQLKAFFGG